MAVEKGSGDQVAQPQAGFLNAESRRSLDNATFAANAVRSVQMPRDTVVKRMICRLIATYDVTFASGSPTLSPLGAFERIVPQVEINVNGNRIIKSVSPYLMRLMHILKSGQAPRRAYEKSASAFTTLRAGREWFSGTIAYQATTGFHLHNEVCPISFELDLAYGSGRLDTELDIRDVASADVKFYFGSLDNLQTDGVGATVTYANTNVYVESQIIENRARPRPASGQALFDYVETVIRKSHTAQASNQQIELQTGNFLMGLGILCRDGDSAKTPKENLLTQMSLKVNGATAVQGPVSHAALQDENQARYGASDDLGIKDYNSTIASTTGEHPLKGYAFMGLIRNGDWNTGINTSRQSGVDTIKLEYSTPSASGTDAATYTNTLEVSVHTHEVRPFAYNR